MDGRFNAGTRSGAFNADTRCGALKIDAAPILLPVAVTGRVEAVAFGRGAFAWRGLRFVRGRRCRLRFLRGFVDHHARLKPITMRIVAPNTRRCCSRTLLTLSQRMESSTHR